MKYAHSEHFPICKELKEMLIISKNNANEDEVSVINKSIEVIDKIIDTDE